MLRRQAKYSVPVFLRLVKLRRISLANRIVNGYMGKVRSYLIDWRGELCTVRKMAVVDAPQIHQTKG